MTRALLFLTMFALLFSSAFGQGRKISGNVTSDGSPVPAATVKVSGTANGTVTDANGHFEITANPGDQLEISSIGYLTQKIEVPANGSSLQVVLQGNAKVLNETVVTALGIKRSTRTLGYSEEQISGSEIARSNAPNVVNALSGKMAGVNITNPNGVDGGSTRILIGGNNTIQGNNQPLIIVDGMPMANDFSASAQNVTAPKDWGSPINLINAEDIEDISVLKGPAAAALYGGRGANGVILITTKKGLKRQGLGVNYSVSYKTVQPYRYIKMQNEYGAGGMVSLDAPQYLTNADGKPMLTDGWNGLFVDPKTNTGPYGVSLQNQVSWTGSGVSWGPKMDGTNIQWWDGTQTADVPQPDNIKAYYKNGMQISHSVSVSGGNEWGTLRASYTRLDNTAIIPNSDYDQNTFNLGANMQMSKRLSLQITASYFINNYHNAPQLGNDEAGYQSNLIYAYGRNFRTSDLDNYKNIDGSENQYSGFPWTGNGSTKNLYWNTYENNTWQTRRKLLASAQLNYTATDFLDLMVRAGTDANNNESTTKNYPPDVLGLNGLYSRGFFKDNAFNFDYLATLHKNDIGQTGISAKLSVGGTAYQRDADGLSANNGYSAVPFLYSFNYYRAGTDISNIQVSEYNGNNKYIIQKKMNSLYGFLNLSYKNYLYIDVTGRNDWSSALPKGEWSYFFPSVSGSFIFTDALHMESSVLSFGKVRVAWAEAATDPDPYQINYVYNAGTFSGQLYTSLPTTLPAQHYKPAINRTADFGVVLGFLNDRINLDMRYYHGRSVNQILNSPLPMSSGVTGVVVNNGVLENSGFEAILKARAVNSPAIKWDIALNIAHNSNRLLSLSQGLTQVDMNNIWGASGVYISALVHQQFGTILSYDYVYDPKTHMPILQDEADLAKNGFPASMKGTLYESTPNMVSVGNATPKITGGITNTFTFNGGLSVSMLVDTKIGGQIWSGTYASMMQQGTAPETLKERDGGGLPYTTPSGQQTNWGVILPGVYPDGTVNTNVVHYYYKYIQYGVWSSGPNGSNFVHSNAVFDDSWVKMRELSINYTIPDRIVKKTKVFQAATISLVGRDLFYFYSSLPDNINPEGVNGVGNAQGIEFASLPGYRSFGVQARFSF